MPVTTSQTAMFYDGWLSWLSLYTGGCGLSDTVKSPGAEGSEKDISENWSFSGSYAANVNGTVQVCHDG